MAMQAPLPLRVPAGWLPVAGGALACAGAMGAVLLLAPTAGGLIAAAYMPVLAAVALVDGRHLIIPDGLNAVGLCLGLAYCAIAWGEGGSEITFAVLRGAVAAALFLALREGYRKLRRRDGLGLGDVKLAGVAGVWLSPFAFACAVEMAALAGLLAFWLLSGRSLRSRSRVPFGLFFAPAIGIGLLIDLSCGGGIAELSSTFAALGTRP